MKKEFRAWRILPFAYIVFSLFVLIPLTSVAEPLTEAQTAEILAAKLEAAVIPDPDINHRDRFEEKAQCVSEGNIDLVFLGDSITHHWDNAGKEVQKKYFGDIRLVNLGMGWNRTQHVLWELEAIDAEKISPKAVMVMIGTNNLGKGRRAGDVIAGRNCGGQCRHREESPGILAECKDPGARSFPARAPSEGSLSRKDLESEHGACQTRGQ